MPWNDNPGFGGWTLFLVIGLEAMLSFGWKDREVSQVKDEVALNGCRARGVVRWMPFTAHCPRGMPPLHQRSGVGGFGFIARHSLQVPAEETGQQWEPR
jgi:hypothetical protein